jgi:acetyltransferase-like isoleucine patch superfamily enzyme
MNGMTGFVLNSIHPSAIVSPKASIGSNVTIGANSIIYDNVVIGSGTIIGPNSILGEPMMDFYHDSGYENTCLSIGENSLIRSGGILYAGSEIGAHFESGHRVTIREYTRIGEYCRVGTLSDIQGYCVLGDYVRLHSNVHIGQKSRIGNYVWIFPYAVLTNDPYPPSEDLYGVTVEDFAVIATKAVILPGVTIGKDALVGAMALVRDDVPAETIVAGVPAKSFGSIRDLKNKNKEGEQMYPWRYHFDRGMPWSGKTYQGWEELHSLANDPSEE